MDNASILDELLTTFDAIARPCCARPRIHDVTTVGDERRQYLCLSCGHRKVGDPIRRERMQVPIDIVVPRGCDDTISVVLQRNGQPERHAFRFGIGEIVQSHGIFGELRQPSLQREVRYQVVEQIASRCTGGVQLAYLVRAVSSSGELGAALATVQEHELRASGPFVHHVNERGTTTSGATAPMKKQD